MFKLNFSKDTRFAVLGLGQTGQVVIDTLKQNGYFVVGYDDKNQPWSENKSDKFDMLIASPGINFAWPKMHPMVAYARSHLIPVLSDLDLFFSAVQAPVIGITGTNGKSTTTALIGHILKKNGYDTDIGGNFGVPVLNMRSNAEIYVLELSSYQLDLSTNIKCHTAVLLNVTPDHLHRHGGMYGYVAAKEKVFLNSCNNVICVDDNYTRSMTEFIASPITVSGTNNKAKIYWKDNILYDDQTAICETTQVLSGQHNQQNIAAAYAALKPYNIKNFRDSLESFRGLEHRQEIVATHPFLIINDSKATNADAVEQALLRYQDYDILWIAGGRPKEGGITPLIKYFDKIKEAFLIGEAEANFSALLTQYGVRNEQYHNLSNVIDNIFEAALAYKKPVILFSPACASFDQFKSFEERGDIFKKYIKAKLNGID